MSSNTFNHTQIHSKYTKLWQDSKLYSTPDITSTKPKKYILDAFSYPSGKGIHAGHAEGYIATDIVSRFYRQKGYDVLFPVGFDSFGLPAENYAIKSGVHPRINTDETINYYREQITALGLSNDWNDEFGTHNQDYYKWTQWFFSLLYKRGLAYKKEALVNWDPVDQTVLANEQVLADGTAERSGAKVEQKMMSQWFFKITDYAERLLNDLDKLDWPESTKLMQKNWIGKSVGAEVDFVILDSANTKNLNIRLAKPEDAKQISYIRSSGWLQNNISPENGITKEFLEKNGHQLPVSEDKIKFTADFLTQKVGLNYVGELNGKIVSYLGIGEIEKDVYEFGIYVHPDFQGIGIGKKTMNYIFQKYVDKTFKLTVNKTNIKAIELYKKLGFAITGETKWFPKDVPDKFLPLYTMTREVKVLLENNHDINYKFQNQGPNYLFIHGWEGSSSSNNLPTIKEFFETLGLKVQIPTLPNSSNPNIGEQARFVLENCEMDENTIIIGHSLGVSVGLNVIQNLDFKIKKFVSVAGFVSNDFKKENLPQGITDPFDISKQNFDFELIKSKVGEFKGIWSDDDQFITLNQTNFLGNSLGFETKKVSGYKHLNNLSQKLIQDLILDKVTVFTTRIDTLFSGTFLILAPENPLVDSLTIDSKKQEVLDYQQKTKAKTPFERTEMNKEKTGVWTGSYAINPGNGSKMQVWISDFVLGSYGTGAVFADSHDERDFEMAKKFAIPLTTSIKPKEIEDDSSVRNLEECYSGYGILYNSAQFDGLESREAMPKIIEFGESFGWAKPKVTYRLRDWLVSRQRYWGSPIPIVYKDGKEILVPESDLPVILPDDVEFQPSGVSPLINHTEFHRSAELKYGIGARREVDTMDTFACSSWYFFRFMNPHNIDVFASTEALKKWNQVDEYVIGAEHCVLHLLYARFFTKVLFDAGYIDFDEPFAKVTHPGMILGDDNRKMSKRWGNVINPIDVVTEFGADTLRLYVMFMGPFEQAKPWNTNTLKGVRRFLDRVWKMQNLINSKQNSKNSIDAKLEDFELDSLIHGLKVESALHKLIKKVSEDITNYSFNTSVAEFMKFVNFVEEIGNISVSQFDRFLNTLAPFAPYITEELWQTIICPTKVIFVDAINTLFKLEDGLVSLNVELLDYLNVLPQKKIIITNAKDEILAQIKTTTPFEVYSLEFSPVKTDSNYFVQALKDLNLKASEIIYFDHSQDNLDSATKSNIQTILYSSNQQIRRDLNQLLSIHFQPFPKYDPKRLVESEVTIGVQINGKVRGDITLSPELVEEEAKKQVLQKDFVQKYIEDKEIKKFVYKAGKIINIVV
jgi:leucyl-tRNA synthetase family protein